ncbi:unnamed protein product [Penicillium salamii]|uniref:MATE efflux family protein n=1 Tax=Penicillium salamii TaxID=1612424 RepID=A0A9W4J955_9EURO|nr:unnamed protein product [Penicillium salamii]CAG7981911.1 unnamed protein product [Penicillium salamii]CAG8163198.1 unnamed protein product [Penicillium salamii]CAG8239393.1 unnamed protein product [Penicillium salamii]CAG8239858.1 unnamed protein product [Penicillium salamii]
MDNQYSGVTNSGLWSRQTYLGSVIFNLGAFALPALYGTLSKLWVANIDPRQVATTDIYTYIGVIVEVLNESLPRTAWLVIGDSSARTLHSRLNLAYTMILVQTVLGVCMTVIFLACSRSLASGFVPLIVREASITYVRLSSVQAVTSAIEAALSASMRALDNPDVPLIISSAKFVVNILLDLLIISKMHVGAWKPTVVMQAIIRLACDTIAALAGLTYFLTVVVRRCQKESTDSIALRWSLADLKLLSRPSIYTFAESAIRNAIYLWLVHQIVLLGSDYATSWGVFNTIRWGLIMVPVQALEASTLTFVGHNWGVYGASKSNEQPRASRKEIIEIIRPSFRSSLIVLVFETVTCIVLSLRGIEAFARYLSGSSVVAKITQTMWKSIDWTYIFYGVNCQLAAILLATSPRWYLYQSLGSNFLWMLPWAIVVTTLSLPTASAWTYYAIIFGGALVFDSGCVCFTLTIWAYRLMRGKIGLTPGA